MEDIILAKAVIGKEPYATQIEAGTHTFLADEPMDAGGQDLGPTPSRLLCAALASCIGITLKMYAGRKQWDTGNIEVNVELDRSGDTPIFSIGLSYENELPQDAIDRLRIIAGKCPVHKLLHHGNTFRYLN